MSYRLFLDDYRKCPRTTHEWVVAKSLAEFKRAVLTRGIPEVVSFDHDLTEPHYGHDYSDKLTGYDAMLWLGEHCEKTGQEFPFWAVHSMNVERTKLMNELGMDRWPAKRLPLIAKE